jgi:hypothetical protein
VLLGNLDADPTLTADRSGQTVIADRHYCGGQFESTLNGHGITLLRPARAGEPPQPGARLFKPLRQVIESRSTTPSKASSTSNNTAATPTGVWVRVLQRVLALTAVIRHNDQVGAPTPRSLIDYDH